MKKLLVISTAALLCGLTGCTSTETEVEDIDPGDFKEDSGQEEMARPETSVHPGPYSFSMQGILPPWKFFGYYDRLAAPGAQTVHISDFWNPGPYETTTNQGDCEAAGATWQGTDYWTGTCQLDPTTCSAIGGLYEGQACLRIFPEGHPYAGQRKPKALVLMMSAVWCAPCNYEADAVLPGEVPGLVPDVRFLSVLVDGQTPGTPATLWNLENWADRYQVKKGVSYGLAIDPTGKIMNVYEPAFPGNMVIDTKDMRMVYRVAGVMEDDLLFWEKIDDLVSAP